MLVMPDPNTLLDDLDIVVADASSLLIEGGSAGADPTVLTTTTDATGPVPPSITITITVTPTIAQPAAD
ncbi:MAG TPA: hypothetical protein VE826_07445 [Dongiaceae bacterium]|nr:hypothetical protein [Dongiaceae bacterium]